MAKKELRRAARGPKKVARPTGPRRPTIQRSAMQAAILAVIYMVVVRLVFKSLNHSFWKDLYYTASFFVLYTVLIFLWERYLFKKRAGQTTAKK